MQSRTESLIESLLNIGSGFVISFALMQLVITPVFGLPTEAGDNLSITAIFTIVSITRSYLWRRLFNRRHLTDR